MWPQVYLTWKLIRCKLGSNVEKFQFHIGRTQSRNAEHHPPLKNGVNTYKVRPDCVMLTPADESNEMDKLLILGNFLKTIFVNFFNPVSASYVLGIIANM